MLPAHAQESTQPQQPVTTPSVETPYIIQVPFELHILLALAAILAADRLFSIVLDRITRTFQQPHVGVSPEVLSNLYQVMHLARADRAYIALFHNGINTVTGLRFVRFSVFYEASKPEAGSYAGTIQNTALSRAHREYHDCMNDPDRMAVYSRSEVPPGCRQVLDRCASQTMAVHILMTPAGLPYGFLGLHYVEEQDAVALKAQLVRSEAMIRFNQLSAIVLQQGTTTFWRSLPNRIRALFGQSSADPFSFLEER